MSTQKTDKQQQAERANNFEKQTANLLDKALKNKYNVYTDKESTIPDGS